VDIGHREEGVPSWVELATPDAETSIGFYSQLFGWTHEGFGDDLPGARTCLLLGRPVAVIKPAAGIERGAWTMHIDVADADKTAEKVLAAGGRIVTPAYDLGAAGRTAVFADHSGTVFAVWQSDRHAGDGDRDGDGGGGDAGVDAADVPGAFHSGELITDDVEASAAFYGSLFGWTLSAPQGPLNRREWRLDGRPIAELLPRPAAMPAEIPPYWDVYFTVADAAATTEAVTRLGGTTLMPATPVGHGTIAVFADPTGAVFTVLAPAR
jgi:predicted enzyme related to lactoylglutathione lyase